VTFVRSFLSIARRHMESNTPHSNPRELYVAAYSTHYGSQDLSAALRLYGSLISAHPNVSEAAYARTQVQNIVKSAVPMQELFDAGMALAVTHLDGQVTDAAV
jgi:hypothetical protein